jgi:type III secretion protein U
MAEKKQFEASAKKLRDAREKGDLAKSQLVTQTAVITGGCLYLVFFGVNVWERIMFLVEYGLSEGFREPVRMMWAFGVEALHIVLLFILVVVLFGLAAELSQVGFMWRPSLALPDLKRIDPIAGFGRLFSGVKKSLNFLLRAGVVVAVAYMTLSNSIEIGAGSLFNPNLGMGQFSDSILRLLKYGLCILGLFSVAELLKTKKDYQAKLSMSLDDVRRENKDEEGNPEIKHQRKHLHRAMINQDLVTRVRRSKMVVVSKRGSDV